VRRALVAVGLLLSCAGSARAASGTAASSPVAVVPFTGLHADEPQHAVSKTLGERAAVVQESDLAAAKPDAIVRGVVAPVDGKLTLTITISNGAGEKKSGFAVPITGRHLTPEQLKKLAADVDDQVAEVLKATPAPPPVAKQDPLAEPPPEPAVNQAGDTEKAPLTVVVKAPKKVAPLPRVVAPSVPRPVWYPFIDAQVGAIVTSRSLAFAPARPPIFNGGTAAGVHAELALYPLAFLHTVAHGVLSGIGGWVSLDAPIWPNTQFEGTPLAYDTSEMRIEGGGRFRLVARKLDPRLELSLFGGAGLHSFSIAKATAQNGALVDAGPPDARYIYGVFGLSARATIRERWSPWVSVAYEYVPDAGPTEDLNEYGLSSTNGLVVRAGVEVRVWRRLRAGVSGFYERIMMSFENQVPTQRHADSALDEYFGAVFMVGYDI
jgi:hypothetical protein